MCVRVCVWRGCLCAFSAMSTFSPVGSQCSNGMKMCMCVCEGALGCVCVSVCVCVCVCVRVHIHMRAHGMNFKCAQHWHSQISYLILCQCYTQAHACTYPQTIWGQRTNRAKSGYCYIFMQCRSCQLRFNFFHFQWPCFAWQQLCFPLVFTSPPLEVGHTNCLITHKSALPTCSSSWPSSSLSSQNCSPVECVYQCCDGVPLVFAANHHRALVFTATVISELLSCQVCVSSVMVFH